MRDGDTYLAGLRARPRRVWLHGDPVGDVTVDPALAGPATRIAELYAGQHLPEQRELLVGTADGAEVPRALTVPRSRHDLRLRAEAFRARAEPQFGLLGRAPDFAGTALAALAAAPRLFSEMGPRFVENIERYVAWVRAEDPYVVPAITAPQIDRSPDGAGTGAVTVVAENADGLIVRGAKMICTSAPIADEILVYNPPVLRPGDEPLAAVFAVPVDAPGLRMICRPPLHGPGTDPEEHPLAARFEEVDALLVFDDVLVPWDRVFLHGSVDLSNALHRRTCMPLLVGQQAGIRALVKLELLTGVAVAVARAVRADAYLHVQSRLGQAVAGLEQARALLATAEVEHGTSPEGVVFPGAAQMGALRVLLARQYRETAETVRAIGGSGLVMRPSLRDAVQERAGDLAAFLPGAGGLAADDRIRLFNLAWDLVGDGFGQRAELFECFGGGDPLRVSAGGYLAADRTALLASVDRAVRPPTPVRA
ncbi:4-hydroxyphenylacetate 3-hydroxylase N-terminal domain-containing protein [Solwaraspora sp. WMMB335]|uniref:4-hydroxyphenylacetate 3-hydroxylase N-terminal domain-containing protein n=1 Tax=Solwaraspora sp. WMMB335 TaxID=3404118 RepID=UPI003B95D62D